MSNGWPIPSPGRRGVRTFVVPVLTTAMLVIVGCSQGEKRSGGGMFGSGNGGGFGSGNGGGFGSGNGGGFGSGNGGLFGSAAPKPLFPKAATPRAEPDLRVQAAPTDPRLLARLGEGEVEPRVEGMPADARGEAPRVELFRSASSSRSLEALPPVD